MLSLQRLVRNLQAPVLKRNASKLAVPFKLALNPNPKYDGLSLGKITATIGPASENLPIIHDVVESGVNIMRINFSHATYDEALLRVTNLNSYRRGLNKSAGEDGLGQTLNMKAIMLDTQGPEIRTGSFAGVSEISLVANSEITLTTDDSFRTKQSADKLWISYKSLHKTVCPGSIILVDDGAFQLEVKSIGTTEILCKLLNSGSLGNKKGVNMPGLVVELPALSKKDEDDIRWGIDHNIDMIAASFVRKPTDVSEIRTFCSHVINELKSTKNVDRLMPLIVSKIESTEALENFEEILEISDAIMVARGDLAVEIPPETLAGVQMQIVRRCNEVGKPVIVATQMLETMQKNPRPTRAELTDVANAIQEGADCVMLSGESAKGKYPIESVSMMRKIILQTESLKELESISDGIIYNDLLNEITNVPEDGAAKSAVTLSNVLTASVAGIIVNVPFSATQQELSSHLPQLIAKYRPNVPIFTIVPTYPVVKYKKERNLCWLMLTKQEMFRSV